MTDLVLREFLETRSPIGHTQSMNYMSNMPQQGCQYPVHLYGEATPLSTQHPKQGRRRWLLPPNHSRPPQIITHCLLLKPSSLVEAGEAQNTTVSLWDQIVNCRS